MKHCALTGHRSLPADFDKNRLYDQLEELIKSGCSRFYCGMAEGFDLVALDCLVALKQNYRFEIVACIPFKGHESTLSAASRKNYGNLLSWCDAQVVCYLKYRKGCYLMRDRYMVDKADILLAYCKKDTGGAAYTVKYAKEKNLEIMFIE